MIDWPVIVGGDMEISYQRLIPTHVPSSTRIKGAGGQQQRETPLAITNGRPSTPAFGSSSVDHLLSKEMRPTLNNQMESNMAVAGRSQTAGVPRPLAGPSQTAGVSNICANYEDLLADFH
ncbi:hypothetical protein DAPPUDRAFT_260173 [Daphnia pulex]|uniref:Uncharacterized protein n=1 Tax=Daphnia pulex TaxID=6669 RepID=E9HIN1_DAPPU|nr:hypothetical protein DAPPUDRAFT_260173 [Daphnia pulex]|eukprot:EFX68384.1 hypothetical protein DAPPUDRAFT_260173 [Daphnia pulex]